jgi:E3 ubiquitin-protein ligase Topors
METESETTMIAIKGAAKEQDLDKRKKLLERLAKAKAQLAPPPLVSSTPASAPAPSIDVGETKRARLTRDIRSRIQLKIKLESEKKQFRTNINESKAQELRRKLLEAKAKREAEETDLVLKRLDMIDRKREVRRRLMVLKMMAAETDQERRARELREKLVARKAAASGQGIRA